MPFSQLTRLVHNEHLLVVFFMNMSHDGVTVMIMKYYFGVSIKIFDVGKFNTKLCSPEMLGWARASPPN